MDGQEKQARGRLANEVDVEVGRHRGGGGQLERDDVVIQEDCLQIEHLFVGGLVGAFAGLVVIVVFRHLARERVHSM